MIRLMTFGHRIELRGLLFLLAVGLLCLLLSWPVWTQTRTDHTRYEVLNQNFKDGPAVTRACLTCHEKTYREIERSPHWTWGSKRRGDGQFRGKGKGVINNFCIAVPSNWARCTSCHIGYGYTDQHFDFSDKSKIDCLICHDTTGTYKKFPTGAGHPLYKPATWQGKDFPVPNLRQVAMNVGKPSRNNCGSCHFFGGGGEGVKHGDLDTTLISPSRDLDVHMNPKGANLQCQSCHRVKDHLISGRYYEEPAYTSLDRNASPREVSCESCHSAKPHKVKRLNSHSRVVSCATCHIPALGRGKPTKIFWDWSTAGRHDEKGKEILEIGPMSQPSYDTKKGSFLWAKNQIPEYYFYDGTMGQVTVTDKIDDKAQPVKLNFPKGNYGDHNARIWPFKVHRGKQVYDSKFKNMVYVKLFGPKESGAYWKNYDWKVAIEKGMESEGLPFSGEYAFIETETYWPLKHMVAPKEKALKCLDCHAPKGRLALLTGFYMPGRDGLEIIDYVGAFLIFIFAVGAVVYLVKRRES